jgi:CBS domain-containing protein
MKTVKNILEGKGRQIYWISPEKTVFDALKLMAEKDVGALIVMDEGNVVGIMSERDYARKVALEGKSSKDLAVREIMSDRVMFVNPFRSSEECISLMTNKRVRHLPVMENNKIIGLISIGDVVKAVIDEKQFHIDQLVHYIKGKPPIKE